LVLALLAVLSCAYDVTSSVHDVCNRISPTPVTAHYVSDDCECAAPATPALAGHSEDNQSSCARTYRLLSYVHVRVGIIFLYLDSLGTGGPVPSPYYG
jgi:hypothetical protein